MALRIKKLPLSKELGISRNTLMSYLLKPGAPPADQHGAYDLEAVRFWCSEQAAKAKSGNTAVPQSDYDKLRQEKIRMEIEHSRWEFEKGRGEYIHRSEIAATVWALLAEENALYRQAFYFELPFKYKGKTAIECQAMNEDALYEIAKRVKEGMLPLTGKEAEPQSA